MFPSQTPPSTEPSEQSKPRSLPPSMVPVPSTTLGNRVDQSSRPRTAINEVTLNKINRIPVRITRRGQYGQLISCRRSRFVKPVRVDKTKINSPSIHGHGSKASPSLRSLPNVMVLNARSIFNKVDELTVHIENYKSDMIFVSETWLSENIPNEAIHIGGYNVFRNDRVGTRGGGVALYINDNIPVEIRNDLNSSLFECLWMTARPTWLPRKISRFALACIYLPPLFSSNDLEIFYEYFQSCYDTLMLESCDTAFIIAGDFNPSSNGFRSRVLNTHCNLKQVINKATRNDSILDLIFTNIKSLYKDPEIIAPLASADHNMVIWYPQIQRSLNVVKKVIVRPLKTSALENFRLFLASYEWENVICADTVDDKLEEFLAATNTMINDFFPTKTVKLHENDKYFITAKLKKLICARNKAFKQGNLTLFRSLRNQVKREIRVAKAKHKDNILGNCNKNSSKWWKNISQLTGRKKPSKFFLCDPENQATMNDKETANYINNFFASLTKDFPDVHERWFEYGVGESLPIITKESVVTKLRNLKTNKASCLNDPNCKLLKIFAEVFAIPLTHIFNESFKSKRFPTTWKEFCVIPIPKCVSCTSVEQLRPIALTSVISKLQESYVVKWINEDVEGKISKAQYGGQPGSSAVLALIYLVHKWQKALDVPGFVIRLMFLDFRKAYDLIDHNILLENCSKIGIRPALISWLASYLSGRSQVTKFGNELSERDIIHGGVPQGSKIGPVAFIVHLNGLPSLLKQSEVSGEDFDGNDNDDDVSIFMDDTTISEIINIKDHKSGNVIGNATRNMSEVAKFTKEQKMKLNLEKCKEMLIDLRRNKTVIPPVNIDNHSIERVRTYKLLGLWIDDDMKWKTNTEKIVKKAAKRLFFLKVLKSYGASSNELKKFYITVIRPVLEYGAQVWHGGITKEQCRDIERIQKRALRIIYKNDDYDVNLYIAEIERLEIRRDRMCIDLIKDMMNVDHKLHKLLPKRIGEIRKRETRLNSQMYYNFKANTERFRNSPITYAILKYNECLS